MTKSIKIYLADDHAVVREGVKRLIETHADLAVCGEGSSGAELISAAGTLSPDVIVLDISMPEISGAPAAKRLKETCPGAAILVLTVHEDTSYVREMLQAGAIGYVLKRSPAHELVHAIRCVAAGRIYVDPQVAGKLVHTLIPSSGRSSHPFADLSDRETEVLRLIAQGYSNREISENLNISTKTVETYKARSMEKLGLHSRVDLMRIAVQRGWLCRENFAVQTSSN